MGLKPKKSAQLGLGILLAVLLVMSIWGGAALAAGEAAPVQYREGSVGSLEIRIISEIGDQYPPGDLILSDPAARMTGSDSRANANYNEIPGATYTAENITRRQEAFAIYVDNAVSGTYGLRVIGADYGRYVLTMRGYDQTGVHADVRFTANIEPGQVHHYVINYSNLDGASLRVRRTRVSD